jgi:DNA-binding NtrC family response regulator
MFTYPCHNLKLLIWRSSLYCVIRRDHAGNEYRVMAKTVLIVQAEPAESQRLADIVTRLGLEARIGDDASIAFSPDFAGAETLPSLIILDLDLPGLNAASFIGRARAAAGLPVVAIADPGAAGPGKEALEAGAFDVIVKPASAEQIESAVRGALKIGALEDEIARIRRELDGKPGFSDLIAVSSEMQRAVSLARRAAELDLPVLLEGEPGTGRKLFARTIRAASARASAPFVTMNGAAEPGASLLEERWAEARGGVLFIEEIAGLPSAAQAMLAEHLKRQSFAPGGGECEVRLICSSSKNLIDRVRKGEFREDLYYRINVFPVWLPPLRDRVEDIPALSGHFLRQVIVEQGKRIEDIEERALSLLKSYVWPGNVRQLENAIFRAVVLAEGGQLTVRDFPQIAAQAAGLRTSAAYSAPAYQVKAVYEGPVMIGGGLPANRAISLTPVPNSQALGIPALTEEGEIRRLDEIEADVIRLALGHYRGHITEVARRLGIGRSTLYRKMREFGLGQ